MMGTSALPLDGDWGSCIRPALSTGPDNLEVYGGPRGLRGEYGLWVISLSRAEEGNRSESLPTVAGANRY
jgi:hypothetical protein